MKILLIRHGETTGDLEDRYGGTYDDHLTPKGQEQLQKTADALTGVQVDKMFVSPLIRARESADIINGRLNTNIEVMEGLSERNYGVLGGLTKTEALERYPEAVELHKDPHNTDPEGEGWDDFNTRVVDAFKQITMHQEYTTVVLVSHGGALKAILRHLDIPAPDTIGDGEIIEVEV